MDLALVSLVMITVLTESYIRLLIWRKNGLGPLSWRMRLGYTLPAFVPALAMLLPPFRLPIFYLLFLLLCMIQERVIPTPSNMFNYSIRMRFAVFGCIHMTVMGVLSLILVGWDSNMVVAQDVMLSTTIGVAMLLTAAIKCASLFRHSKIDFHIEPEEQRDFRHLYWFLNLTLVYLFLQAVLSQFRFPVDPHMAVLLCSSFIALIYISCYLLSLAEILRKFHVENSYYMLSASLIESDQRLDNLRSNAQFDNLTGARSRGFVLQALTQLKRYRTPFSLVYLDLNGLKKINDTLGHAAGDAYLQRFALSVQKQIRDTDILARLGGDEFILILLGCSKENAEKRLEVIRQHMASDLDQFAFGAGVVESGEADDLEDLLTLADQRMYSDKKRIEEVAV